MVDVPQGYFYLGETVEPGSGERSRRPWFLESADLTTHAVVTGMTGSGKTGLGVVLLEEALLAGIPCLVIDPKGDMGNLALTFPGMTGQEFAPWVSPDEARQANQPVEEYAAATAARWKEGLADWGISTDRVGRLNRQAPVTVYTPGSSAGVPLNIVGSLKVPDVDWDTDPDTPREEITGLVSGLLGLAGVSSDPLGGREHVLMANIVEESWRRGHDLDLPELIGAVQRPPFRRLGVFDLDEFFPEADRRSLALKLNTLAASPAFAGWVQGPPLEAKTFVSGQGPAAHVVSLSHLSEAERQFVVTLVLGHVVTWMRSQPGTTRLRLLIWMDEVAGFMPPTATPPAKKPIMSLLRQGRAFGVGLVTATQNPMDIDYKAMSNAGTWLVGRLQTERDKARVLEGLTSARGDVDTGAADRIISGLGKRQFLAHSVHAKSPVVLQTRWAMAYLRGPMTRDEIARLKGDGRGAPPTGLEPTPAAVLPDLAHDETTVQPKVAGAAVYYLDPAAPWADEVGAVPGSRRLEAALVARLTLRFDDRATGFDHTEEWEAVYMPLRATFQAETAITVDYDQRDFQPEPPASARYVVPEAPTHDAGYFRTAAKAIADELVRGKSMQIWKNTHVKAASRPGESREDFIERCRGMANDSANSEAARLSKQLEGRAARLRRTIETAEARRSELALDTEERKRQEMVAGAGAILSSLLGGKVTVQSVVSRASRMLGGASSRRSITARTSKRLETAEAKVANLEAELEELENEILVRLAEIDREWSARAEDVEELTIPLGSSDIKVAEVALCWVPAADPRL